MKPAPHESQLFAQLREAYAAKRSIAVRTSPATYGADRLDVIYAVRPVARGLLERSQEVAFFAPLAELALRSLAEAEPGSFSDLDAAARHDLAYARSLSPAQRLAALNDMLLFAEAFGLPPVSREPIVHGELRM